MDFNEYLISKKIDPEAFRVGDPERYGEFDKLFGLIHPNSFTSQKLFLINGIRRLYPLPEDKWIKNKPKAPKPGKPVMKKPAVPVKPTGSKPKFRPKPIIKKK